MLMSGREARSNASVASSSSGSLHRCGLDHESLLYIAHKTYRLVEPMRIGALRAGEENDLVAPLGPSEVERVLEHAAPIPTPAMRGKRDHVFNDAKGPGAARQVGDDRQHAGGDQRLVKLANHHVDIAACGERTESRLGDFGC